ncbi:hypothetical protein SSS_03246 [Sarcoptes scabiei]|nr:hypothetical protein SSS_03246 [Sarcoptes scabiei]KPM10052.1 hypothetical protein QR98_0085990 [Sarcoptes scabiei]UXI20270.1 protein rogdi-like [Sarcoptes scabiei]
MIQDNLSKIQEITKCIQTHDLNREERDKLKTSFMVILREVEAARNKAISKLDEKLKKIDHLHQEVCLSLPSKIRNCQVADFDGEIDIIEDIFNHDEASYANLSLSIQYQKEDIDKTKNKIGLNRSVLKLTNSFVKNGSAIKSTNHKITKKLADQAAMSTTMPLLMEKISKKPPRVARENEHINIVMLSDQGTPLIQSSSKRIK